MKKMDHTMLSRRPSSASSANNRAPWDVLRSEGGWGVPDVLGFSDIKIGLDVILVSLCTWVPSSFSGTMWSTVSFL